MDKRELAKVLSENLPKYRWWPWKSFLEVSIEELFEYNNYVYTIVSCMGEKFYIPWRGVSKHPENIPSDRVIVVDGEYFVEAEFTPDYIVCLRKSGLFIERVYERNPCLERVVNAKPLTLETSNVLAVHSGKCRFIVKSYRKLSRTNLEPLILDLLYRRGFKYIPVLYSLFMFRDYVVSIVMEYVVGEGDGGKPFYDALMNYLSSRRGGYRLGLASLIGVEISEFHKILAGHDHPLFKPEEITSSDIGKWFRRINNLYSSVLYNLDKLSSSYEWVSEWRDFVEKRLGKYVNGLSRDLSEYSGLYKTRTHQDLHLAQFIYNRERGFIFTDLEGEPARSEEERLEKEPVLRDLATLIRSFDYLSFACLKEYFSLDNNSLAWKLVREGDPVLEWRLRHITSIIYSYLTKLSKDSLRVTGLRIRELSRRVNKLVKPWIIERALYELYYETLYRPENIPIPISTLYINLGSIR